MLRCFLPETISYGEALEAPAWMASGIPDTTSRWEAAMPIKRYLRVDAVPPLYKSNVLAPGAEGILFAGTPSPRRHSLKQYYSLFSGNVILRIHSLLHPRRPL